MFFKKNKPKKNEVKYTYRIISGLYEYRVTSHIGYSKMKQRLNKNKSVGAMMQIKDIVSNDTYVEYADKMDMDLIYVESNYFNLELNKKL